MRVSFKENFFNASATSRQKNNAIGNIVTSSDCLDVSDRLRGLVDSQELPIQYKDYVLAAVMQGVRMFMELDTQDKRMMTQSVGQCLHDRIMDEVADINEATAAGIERIVISKIHVPRRAEFLLYTDPADSLSGWHQAGQAKPYDDIEDCSVKYNYEIGLNTHKCHTFSKFVSIIAHETAHHIEAMLSLQHHFLKAEVSPDFISAAEYFHSLRDESAYIRSEKCHDLYLLQANERMAREAAEAALDVLHEYGL